MLDFYAIIAGSRTFDSYEAMERFCDKALSNQTNIEIVSGTASGADRLGEEYAKRKNYQIVYFPADWDKHGKSAGYIRNKQMAEYADALIAFWDGQSKGTQNMIDLAKQHKLQVRVKMF